MKRNIVIAAVTAAALVGGGAATALATTGDDGAAQRGDDDARVTSVKVSAGDAIASALKKAPGTAVSAELDVADGDDAGERTAWEVDVLSGDGTWHSVRIDPSSGKVLGSQTDDEDDTAEVRAALKGTSVDAAEAARAASGHGTVTSVELDDDGDHGDGKPAWEVETHASGKAEQDWRVDAKSGKVTADRPDHSDSDHAGSDDSDSGSDDSDSGSDDSASDDD
ncbi:PepSY domain-containing protein [Streptomyces sp. SID5910]|uniref:PepSY domain-containing protein n=1 Tax=Streptomyces sp. SID5910 TaxID=2690312 RepID=UPI00136E6301|nr:PepSY domain-containing protein [Streptomyces sp. SID5910]MYR45274.1 peptidase propeptide and YpeB domain protein [Streptomyces sp. SID5910]MYR47431.1 peptidase propeptide and YpeB domain protein [Streptomyces sp. SID5910]